MSNAEDSTCDCPNTWDDMKAEMRRGIHPCGSHAFCHMVQALMRDWRSKKAQYPLYYKGEFPFHEQSRVIYWLRDGCWHRAREQNAGLLARVTKATDKQTAAAINLAWPLWRDGPKEPTDLEDIQTIMFWMEMFRGCSITKGTRYWHRFYVRRIQEILAEHDKSVFPYQGRNWGI